jgi:predicted metallo-beta-lactamase superfamily hydrolase
VNIKILGAESLGVRGLSCSVELKSQKILIDTGIALGWSRYGFLPHPFQIAVGAGIREKIIEELKDATDVVFSHFDGDHCPLYNPNPYQLGIDEVKNFLSNCQIWVKGSNNSPPTQQKRRNELAKVIKKDLRNTEGVKEGHLEFSFPVPHGQQGKEENMVMMSRIEDEGEVFVHASDIQLLDEKTIGKILDWKPNIVLASGPPLYRYSSSSFKIQREKAWQNATELSKNVDTLILDHHLLRCEEGIEWLKKLKHTIKNRVFCAADFMKREPLFLEAWRKELYEWLPVSKDWHEDYMQGKVDFNHYRIKGWETLIRNGKIKPCKWYYSCPIKEFTDQGELERYWIENYCLVSNKNCLRYQMEEKGEYHPDNMLPNGKIRKDLK